MAFGSISADKIVDSEGSTFSPSSALFRNRIINGDMRIAQRGTAAVTGNANYPVDRFAMYFSNDGAYSAQQSSTAPAGFTNSIYATTTTADASLSASQFFFMRHNIEGLNVADLAWGSASAKTITLSFQVRSSLTGTFGGSLTNAAENRAYPFTYTISSADTWTSVSITIPGDTGGTWVTNNGVGIRVNFGLGVGSDYSGTAGSWASGSNFLSATGAVSVIGTLNATWYITGVQLEVGSVATPFERRPYGTELALCQRYYYKTSGNTGSDYANGWNSSTTKAIVAIPFPVTMRVRPTALEQTGTAADYTIRHTGGISVCSAVPTNWSFTPTYSMVELTVASGLTSGQGCNLRPASDGIYLAFTAEL